MSKTIHIHERASSGNKPRARLYDTLLALLARLVPADAYGENSAEAQYLKTYGDQFTDLTESDWRDTIQAVIEDPDPAEENLVQLARTQQLAFIEIVVLLLCYEVERDSMLGRCIAYLQKPIGTSRPTLSLLNAFLSPVNPDNNVNVIAAVANSRAVELGLLEMLNETAPLPEQMVKMPPAVALCMATGDIAWPGAGVGLPYPDFDLPESILSLARSQAQALLSLPDAVVVLRSASRQESAITARVIASFCGCSPLFIHDEKKALSGLGPICRAKNLMPVFSYTCGPGEMISIPDIKGYRGALLVTAGLEGAFENARGNLSSWIIPRPTLEERKELWDTHLGHPDLSDRLARDHVHSTARIVELASLARRQSISRNRERVGMDEVREAAWLSESSGLSALAQPMHAVVKDDALIVRPFTGQQLELLEKRCHIRERLGESLGVTIKARYQMGVKALFLGPSGTGKTLAASWLANRLGIPLYRVDLAAITSIYIGETEKNLAKLLGQAEQEEVVLLFDEADSVFGKRTEIKDSNDRFANAQTNYLLQRIETYSGVVILTSNSKARFDSAFTRRLDMMIEFPLPSPEERRAIWLSHLGAYHEMSKANINQLAVQCNLTGGHIRNVVLAAAVIAKSRERKIRFKDVIQALSDEYRKLGKQMVPELMLVLRS
jgi:hypothetical protein